ncbi:phosphotransferase family protein [Mycolicibacterium cosmeticum]|uniref:Phosphotransferase enzyme family protein n=1 Tax=Mycolicibacterium cosmeticum TaxID=258533 RepID=W9AIH8_MYCCO|nr:phosphotransferase family protein [Mycolicibacterium cosmeticum]TLH68865.1 phosphotransferase family protein [Mycolicibacterium cosmeticum]CDO05524.1 phosphotransferase enzyme family protein [Mycolicibacterium cosmeticum]
MVRTPAGELPAALEAIVRQRIPGAGSARVVNWAPSSTGFSTETFLFDITGLDDGGTLGLVFRRPPEFPILPDYDLRRQYLVMQRLVSSPVPVPSVRWIDPGGDALGTPYLVMDRIDGVVGVSDVPAYHGAGIFADTDDRGRAALWNGCVDMIAAVHRVDPHAHRLDFLGPSTPEALTTFLRSALKWAYGGAALHPTFVRALSWLEAHRYEPERVGLCWGDARMSNVLYRPDFTPRAVLDWEIAHLGDQAADISWLLMTDWVSSPLPGHAPAPGTPSREETIDRYERAVGHRVGNLAFTDVTAPLLLAVPLVRLNARIPGVDLADVCAQRIDLVMNS